MKRVERLHAMSEMLRRSGSRGCTADRLANEFGVSIRTVKRDLVALENSGAPIWSRPGPRGGYGLATQADLPPVRLTPAQAVAPLAAVSAAPDAPYADLASVAIRKIMDVLDPPTRVKVDDLARRIWVNTDEPGTRAVRSGAPPEGQWCRRRPDQASQTRERVMACPYFRHKSSVASQGPSWLRRRGGPRGTAATRTVQPPAGRWPRGARRPRFAGWCRSGV